MGRINMFDIRERHLEGAFVHWSAADRREERNRKIRRMYQSGDWTLDGIAELFLLSRERVRQIASGR